MRILKFVSIIALILFIGACTTVKAYNPASSLVPGNVLFYLQVGNMDQFMANVDEFLLSTGISGQINNLTVKSILNLSLAMGMEGMNLDWINMEKPVALAMLPPQPGSKEFENFMFTVPLSNEGIKNYDQFVNIVENKLKSYVKKVKDYIIIGSQPWIPDQVPPGKGMNPGKIAQYAPGSVAFYINPGNIIAATGKTWDQLKADMLSALAKDSSSSGEQLESMNALIALYFDFFKEIQDLSFNLYLDEKGLAGRTDITFTKNGQMHKFSNQIGNTTKTKAMLKYLPRDAFFSSITRVPYSAFEKMYTDLYKAIGIEESQLKELIETVNEMSRNIGPGIALAYDFDFDFKALSQLENQDDIRNFNPNQLNDLFTLDIISVAEVKDYNKIRDFYKNLKIDDLINRMLAEILAKEGNDKIKIKLNFDFEPDLENGGFKYDLFTFGADFDFAQDNADNPMMLAFTRKILNSIMRKFNLYVHNANGKYYMVLGYKGLETLKMLVKDDGFEKSGTGLGNSPAAKRILQLIPDKSDIIYQFSIAALIDLLAEIPTLKIMPLDLEDAPGFTGYVDFDQNTCTAFAAWDSGEIESIFINLLPLISNWNKNDTGVNDTGEYDSGDAEI